MCACVYVDVRVCVCVCLCICVCVCVHTCMVGLASVRSLTSTYACVSVCCASV
jgi:hypothetical protein